MLHPIVSQHTYAKTNGQVEYVEDLHWRENIADLDTLGRQIVTGDSLCLVLHIYPALVYPVEATTYWAEHGCLPIPPVAAVAWSHLTDARHKTEH